MRVYSGFISGVVVFVATGRWGFAMPLVVFAGALSPFNIVRGDIIIDFPH